MTATTAAAAATASCMCNCGCTGLLHFYSVVCCPMLACVLRHAECSMLHCAVVCCAVSHLAPGYPSEYLLVMTDPTASITEEDTKFSDGISSRPCTHTTKRTPHTQCTACHIACWAHCPCTYARGVQLTGLRLTCLLLLVVVAPAAASYL